MGVSLQSDMHVYRHAYAADLTVFCLYMYIYIQVPYAHVSISQWLVHGTVLVLCIQAGL